MHFWDSTMRMVTMIDQWQWLPQWQQTRLSANSSFIYLVLITTLHKVEKNGPVKDYRIPQSNISWQMIAIFDLAKAKVKCTLSIISNWSFYLPMHLEFHIDRSCLEKNGNWQITCIYRYTLMTFLFSFRCISVIKICCFIESFYDVTYIKLYIFI